MAKRRRQGDKSSNNGDRINWDERYLKVVKEQLEDFKNQYIKPSFRGMYYTLVDLGILPKTQENYKQLNKASVRWRKEGLIPIDAFADYTRRIIKDFNDTYEAPEDYVDRIFGYLEEADIRDSVKDEFDFEHAGYRVPLWYEQENYVEIWIEKDAMQATFQSIVDGVQVVVAPQHGNGGVSYVHDNIERLKREQEKGKKIYILYFGDLDPSGIEMDKRYKRDLLEASGIYNYEFVRWSVTKDQMERFDLQTDPDPETFTKLLKDANNLKFMEEFDLVKYSTDPDPEYVWIANKGGKKNRFLVSRVIRRQGRGYIKHDPDKLFAVQLEAMQTPKARAYFRSLILYLIDSLYDRKIRKRVLKEHAPNKIKQLVLDGGRSLVETFEDKEAKGELDDEEDEDDDETE